jgi:hypothetical protein
MDSQSVQTRIILFVKNKRVALIAIISTALFLVGLLLWKNRYTEPADPETKIWMLNAKEQRHASVVTVGLHINSFPTFSFVKNEFLIDGILWFRFPQGAESIKTLEGFTIQNSILQENGLLLYKSAPIIKLLENEVLVSYHIQTVFKTNLDFKHFPLQSHRLSIIVQNKNVTPYELYFNSTDKEFTLAQEDLVMQWLPRKMSVKTGYIKSELELSNPAMDISYPSAVFSIDFQSVGGRDLMSLYFPMLVLFFIIIFCLLIDISDISRLTYVATAFPILVLFRMVIDGVSPSVGYKTHVDFVFYLLVFLSLLILLFQAYVVLTLQKTKDFAQEMRESIKSRLVLYNDIVFMATLLILVASMSFICF